MKISIGSKVVEGPWGGGNLFVKNLTTYLQNKGNKVIYDLSEPDIDLILLTDPRSRKESSSTYNHIEILKYKELVNNNVKVVQRINECDERKFTKNINKFYLEASHCANHVVFVSSWLRDIYLNLGLENKKTSVILAGANKQIFNMKGSKQKFNPNKVKLVTHHWSAHENKGFKIYSELDRLISTNKWKNKIEFTYIGNTNPNYNLINTKIVKPLAGNDLASKLKEHDIYITASINEPSGNHHIEAAQCGLPILYKNSGGIPEYCEGFGVSFDQDFEERLEQIIDDYDFYKHQISQYPFNAEKMCDEFYELFELLVKNEIVEVNYEHPVKGRIYIYRNKIMSIYRLLIISRIKQLVLKIKTIFKK